MKITAVRFECINDDGDRDDWLSVLPGYHSNQSEFGSYFRWFHPVAQYISSKARLIDTEEIVGRNNFLDIFKTWTKCHACALGDKAHLRAFYRGNIEAKYVFIGEAPGEEEDKYGIPFVGKAGGLLDSIISKMGLDPEADVLIVNPVLCRPTDRDGKNRKPTIEEISFCVRHMNELLALAYRRAYFLLGDTARRTFGVTAAFNTPTPFGAVVYHPAYFLRQGVPQEKSKDFDRALEVLRRATKTRATEFPKAEALVKEAAKKSHWDKWVLETK